MTMMIIYMYACPA